MALKAPKRYEDTITLYTIFDSAIDTSEDEAGVCASDIQAYARSLDIVHLAVKPGETPTIFEVMPPLP